MGKEPGTNQFERGTLRDASVLAERCTVASFELGGVLAESVCIIDLVDRGGAIEIEKSECQSFT